MRLLTFLRRNFVSTFIVALVASIAFLLFIDVSRTSGRSLNVSRIDPYVLCTEGKVIVRRADTSKTLEIHDRFDLKEDDRIRTLTKSSATLFWPDWSITRLAEQTNVSINELKKEQSGSTKVDFSLTEGKTWTNIARYLDPDSHFKERFDNDTKLAAVRGTVFEINAEQDYVHTVDHAIAILDNSGTLLTQVSAGNSVSMDNVLQSVGSWSLDLVWNTLNIASDGQLTQERFEQAKRLLEAYSQQTSQFERLQFIVRNFFGMPTGLPFTVTYEGENIHVTIDPAQVAALAWPEAQSLYAAYEIVSGLQNSDVNIESKIVLRDALEKVLPQMGLSQEDLTKYQDTFARAALFDSWASIWLDSPEQTQKLRDSIEQYIKNGANAQDLKSIQDSLSKSLLDTFNSKIEEWRKLKGFEILSDSEWAQKTFQMDTDSIMRDIAKFNTAIDSLTSGK